MTKLEFAVTDVETTGLVPERNDRIIEIAAIRVDYDGTVLGQYASLLNPERDVGPQRIHGISASDVVKAPKFADVAGDIVDVLAGAIFVGHNAIFDSRFIRSEFKRMKYACPEFPHLCTMRLARMADPSLCRRSLPEVCKQFNIRHGGHHCAVSDATATVEVLRHCLSCTRPEDLEIDESSLCADKWPKLPKSGKCLPREIAAQRAATQASLLASLVARLPSTTDLTPAIEEYLLVLDRVLEPIPKPL